MITWHNNRCPDLVTLLLLFIVIIGGTALAHQASLYYFTDKAKKGDKTGKKEGFLGSQQDMPLNVSGRKLTCDSLSHQMAHYGPMCNVIAGAAVAHYRLDDLSVSTEERTVYDVSGKGMHLSIRGDLSVRFVEGKQGLWFDRNGQLELTRPSEYLRFSTGEITVCFWYYQPEGGPNHYEPFVVLYKDDKHFVAVTDHWGDHRVDLKTADHNWLLTVGPRGRGGRWIHCAAVFGKETSKVILSERQVGDRARGSKGSGYELNKLKPSSFDKILIGHGPDWVQSNRTISNLHGCVSDLMIFGTELDDVAIGYLMHSTASHLNTSTVNDLDVRGNLNVQNRMHFGDPDMSEAQGFHMGKSGNGSSLDLAINGSSDQSFRIIGGSGEQHRFGASGDAWHRGDLTASNVRSRNDITASNKLCIGSTCVNATNIRVLSNLRERMSNFAKASDLETLKNEVSEMNNDVETIRDELDTLKRDKKSLKERVDNYDDDLEKAREKIEEKKERISSMEDTVSTKRGKISNLEDTVDSKRSRLENKSQEIQRKEEELEEKNEKIRGKNQEINNLKNSLDSTEKELEEAQEKGADEGEMERLEEKKQIMYDQLDRRLPPIGRSDKCGPSNGSRCADGRCCSIFDWCGSGTSHCEKWPRSKDSKYHGIGAKGSGWRWENT